jgi:hypothetical protein
MRHSEGIVMRIRHSSEAVAKMQSSDIEPNNRNPDLTTFLPSFLPSTSHQATSGFNTTTWIENRRLEHT